MEKRGKTVRSEKGKETELCARGPRLRQIPGIPSPPVRTEEGRTGGSSYRSEKRGSGFRLKERKKPVLVTTGRRARNGGKKAGLKFGVGGGNRSTFLKIK